MPIIIMTIVIITIGIVIAIAIRIVIYIDIRIIVIIIRIIIISSSRGELGKTATLSFQSICFHHDEVYEFGSVCFVIFVHY